MRSSVSKEHHENWNFKNFFLFFSMLNRCAADLTSHSEDVFAVGESGARAVDAGSTEPHSPVSAVELANNENKETVKLILHQTP